jgi:hypothetical protein
VFLDGLSFIRTCKSARDKHTAKGAGVVVIIGVVVVVVGVGVVVVVVVGTGVIVVVGTGVVVEVGSGVVVVVISGGVVVAVVNNDVVVGVSVVVDGGGVVVVVVVGNMVRGNNLHINSTPLKAALTLPGFALAEILTRTKPVVECSWYLFSCIDDKYSIESVVHAS